MNVERYYEKSLLRLPENKKEREEQIKKFNNVVDMVDLMMEVNTVDMKSYEITSEMKSPLRQDEIKESTDRELVFANTKHREYGYFKLDNILED